jgi:hypothetical protein
MLGETARDCNVVVMNQRMWQHDDLYSEIMDWLAENNTECVIMPEIQGLDIRRLMLVFQVKASMPLTAQRANDGYMLLKLTYAGDERIGEWQDDEWVRSEFKPAW